MADASDKDLLIQIRSMIEENISDEQFGVSELARAMGMSRSNLLRKIKKLTHLSASRFIRQVRLQQAMELLKQTSFTVSEISFQVGFKSPSYFIKCFREHYGYPPGEAEERDFNEDDVPTPLGNHRLAAIMFTDIQGYTSLMQKDEEQAIQIRNRHRQIFNSTTEKFGGEILQYYGDGTLSIFSSAIDAVKCGIELQRGFLTEPAIPVRIGIHSGDIIANEEEIIGDGVNVASRIESLATAGSVLISGKVHDEVKNQVDIQCTSLNTFEFKNVEQPLEIFAVTNKGLVIPLKEQLTGKLKTRSPNTLSASGSKKKRVRGILALLAVIALAAGWLIYRSVLAQGPQQEVSTTEHYRSGKSIAVLPFINDSNDSTNVYIINGLMESILNHLQKIEDLRVISRTSVEKYRNSDKLIPEIAQELNVQYFVEGSGQKIDDQLLLTIQLIDGASDQHLWSAQYNRAAADIFSLQKEVAMEIANEIEVVITPETVQKLDEIPTESLQAYDYFLKGLDLFYAGTPENLELAIGFYEQAIDLDPEFSRAYAGIAIGYFFLDHYRGNDQSSEQINYYADKALLYDAQSPQSMIAKALFYIHRKDYNSAIPHLEKALEYNPNSALVINILADFYTRFVPNTKKYLEYALKGIGIDIASNDSISISYIYLHLSNAFIQSGFEEEAERYINKSLSYNPQNWYAAYVKAFIGYAQNRDLAQTKGQLIEILQVDSLGIDVRLEVLQEVGKICYFMRDYELAYQYYSRFIELKEAFNPMIHPEENAKIAVVMRASGKPQAAEKYLQLFSEYVEQDQSLYQDLNRAMIVAYKGNKEQALKLVRQFSEKENYHYWTLLFLGIDPLMDELKDLPAFRQTMRKIERKFWEEHQEIKTELEDQQLI